MNIETRPELDPFEPFHFVLCKEIYILGLLLKFGDQVPDGCDLNHLHHHYRNGVVGTQAELDTLNEPIALSQEDPLEPIAKFVACPDEEQPPLQKQEDRGTFAIENAALLKTKDDLIEYAKLFDIELKKATNISINKMIETLEIVAKEKGLIKE